MIKFLDRLGFKVKSGQLLFIAKMCLVVQDSRNCFHGPKVSCVE